MLKGIFLLLSLLSSITISAATIYLTPAGSGTMNGSSWANAFPGTSLQVAIDGASAGDSIWVAAGTYYPTATNNRFVSFNMRNNIVIMGSFQGSETSFSERSLNCGPSSILSGNINDTMDNNDNSYTIIANAGLDNSAVIDGFEIRDGYDDRSPSNSGNGLGGGVYNGGNGNGNSCSPTFRNCVIVQNYATFGAGMFNNGYSSGNSAPILQNCILAFNTARLGGGGMDSYGNNNGNAAPIMANCIFYENVSNDRAGAIYCWGGQNGTCTTTLLNSALINNSASTFAGGVIVDNSNPGSTTNFSGTAEVVVKNSIFWGNTAADGPQFYILGTGNLDATYSNIDMTNQLPDHPISGPGTGNIFTDPTLLNALDAMGIDDCWMTSDDGLSLLINSPVINAGDGMISEAFDVKGEERVSGASIDMGPYEYQLLDSIQWSGASSVTWDDPDNWLPARSPDSTQHVSIPAPLSNYPSILDQSIFIRSLLLDDEAQIQILGVGELNVVGN